MSNATLDAVIDLGTAGGMVPANKELAELVNKGLVQVSGDEVKGQIMARATQFDKVAEAAKPAEKPQFVIETGVALPAITRAPGAGRPSKYPFDELAAPDGDNYQSFFVPDSAVNADKNGKRDAVKSLNSVVSQANTRHSEEIPGETKVLRSGKVVPATKQLRKFVVRRCEGGARVFRIM